MMQTLPLRLQPGDDLRAAVVAALLAHGQQAGFVLQGIGSLGVVQLRYAGAAQPATLRGEYEILSLAGSVGIDDAHLHMMIADAAGQVQGGHVGAGCIVRTTVELLLALLPGRQFTREFDARTGYAELTIR